MATQSWERASAPVEGYIVPSGESLERPYFTSSRALAGTASTGGVISVEEGVLPPGAPGPYRHYHPNMTQFFYVLEGELLLQRPGATSWSWDICVLSGGLHPCLPGSRNGTCQGARYRHASGLR